MMRAPVDDGQEVWVVPLKDLVRHDIHVPELQRAVDEDRVEAIVRFQEARLQSGRAPLYIGPLTLARTKVDARRLWLLDGQHRYQSMVRLADRAPNHAVLVVIVMLDDGLTAADVFRLINASVPVPQYVVEGTLHAVRRRMLDEFCGMFRVKYGAFLSKTDMPRRPNINLAQLQDRLHRCDAVVDRACDAKQLMAFVDWVNIGLREWDPMVKAKVDIKAKRCRCEPMYLTADPDYTWLSEDGRWYAHFEEGKTPDEAPALASSSSGRPQQQKRPPIPAALRAALWNHRFGERAGTGTCECCRREITQQQFHAGHVLAVAQGGPTVLSNLVALCGPCNLSMGTRSYEDFAAAFRS